MHRNLSTAALIALFGSFALLYRDVIVKLVHDWANDGNYSHGFLIVPLALYFAWQRRARLATASCRPSLNGLLVVAGSLVVLSAGVLGAELFLTRVSMIGIAAGTIWFVWGREHLVALAFPLAFLVLMIPLPAIIFNQIAFPLQIIASRVGETTLSAMDVPVLREGNVIILPNTSLEVAEACSGLRSLITLLTLGILYGYFSDRRSIVRVSIALATIPAAIVANGLRVAGTGLAANRYGPAAAEGFFHLFSGWLVFAVTLIGLVLAHRSSLWMAARGRQHFAALRAAA